MLLAVRQQRQPIPIGRADDDKPRIQNVFLFIIGQGFTIQSDYGSTGLFDDRLGRCRVPLRGRAEPRVDVGTAFGYDAEFQRAAHRYKVKVTEIVEEGIQARTPV